MCGRILLWALLLGFAGGIGGVVLGDELWPHDHRAVGVALVVGATAGAAVGVAGVLLTTPRRPGD